METYFISDTHFGHKNIITFEPYFRPFSCIEEHDEELVKRWNSVVKPGDKVYHLGDFAMGASSLQIAGRLNGYKELIMGNHDQCPTLNYMSHFRKLHGCINFKDFICTHIPVSDHNFYRFKGNIHGHLHSKNMDNSRYFNVSVEQINLTPINFEEIKIKFEERNK